MSITNPKMNTSGFTITELLIGIAIASIIFLMLGYLTISTTDSTNRLTTTNSLIKEGQLAEQIINGRLSEAIYVWPSGVTPNILLSTSGITTKNTVDPSLSGASMWQWKFGGGSTAYYDPSITTTPTPYSMLFVAMILPPLNPTYNAGVITNCTAASETESSAATNSTNAATATDGCYRFFAYFPMRRSYITNPANGFAESNRPLQDGLNDFAGDFTKDRWVLMEYRANLFNGTSAWSPSYPGNVRTAGIAPTAIALTTLGPYFQGRNANVLADYIKPGSVSFTVYRPGSPDTNGKLDPTITDSGNINSALNTNNGRVDYKFELERLTDKGKTTASSGVLGGSTVIKNWYCPKAMKTSPFALNCPG